MMRKAMWVLLPALFLGACEGNKQELTQALEQAKVAGAEKDSLLSEVLENTKFVNEMNVELAKAKTVGVSPVVSGDKAAMSAKAEERAMILGKMREVIARLEQSEAQLEKTKTRLGQATARDNRLIKQIDDYKTELKTLREQYEAQAALIEEQKGQITVLATQVQEKSEENRQLATEKQTMVDSVATITEVANTVYYIAGTKKDLKEKGIVVDEGSKFLFFGGRQTVPARSLSPELFTALNKTKDTVVPLPASTKGYRIISRHSLDDVAPENLKDGKVIEGDLHITKPEDFWKASNYLILVEN